MPICFMSVHDVVAFPGASLALGILTNARMTRRIPIHWTTTT